MKLFSHLLVLSVVSVFGNEFTGNEGVTDAVDERGIEKFTLADFGSDNGGKDDRGKDGDSQSYKVKLLSMLETDFGDKIFR